MTSQSELLNLSVRIIHGLAVLTRHQKLFWSDSLRAIFLSVPESEIQLLESQGAAKPISNLEVVKEISNNLSVEDRINLVALLKAFNEHVCESPEENTELISQAVSSIEGSILNAEDLVIVNSKVRDLKNSLKIYTDRPTISIPGKIWPLFFDFTLRCLLLTLVNSGILSFETFLTTNFLLVAVVTILLTYWLGNRDRRFNAKLLESYGGSSHFKIRYKFSTVQYTSIGLLTCLGIYTSFILARDFYLASIFLLPLYYFIYIRFFCLGRLTTISLQKQIAQAKREQLILDADKNDEVIVTLETRLTSITSRLEAYVLESALFGALSFSGFLQIMSDNQVTFSILEKFAQQVYNVAEGFLKSNAELLATSLANLNTKENLFCLVSVESLLCSIFFLGVIAIRIRFSNVADRVRFSLNLAKAYNQKEELIIEKQESRTDPRFTEINAKVNQYLHEGEAIMNEVSPIMNLMQYLRNAGLLTFLLILISSAFFITPAIAIGFSLLSLLAWAYFNRNYIQTNIQYLIMSIRVALMKYTWWMAILIALLIGLGLILRIQFKVTNTDGLISTGILILAAYLFIWIVFYPQVDKQFGDIEGGANQWNDRRWLLIKIPVAFFTASTILSIYMKFNHFMGAGTMIMIGFNGIALFTFFLSFYLSKPKWLGLLPSFALSTNLIGTLFKTLHLEGADEMIRVGAFGAGIVILVFIFYRKRFHRLFFFFSIWFMTINVLMISKALDRTGLRYEHQTWAIDKIELARDRAFYWPWIDDKTEQLAEFKLILADSRWYVKEYGQFGFGVILQQNVRNFELFQELAWQLHKRGDDSYLPLAAEASTHLREILMIKGKRPYQVFTESEIIDMLQNENKILQALGRKVEASKAIDSFLLTNPPAQIKNKLEEWRLTTSQ